ncbi:hypothetical protein QBC46DRAFT_416578 [Diplogelasinospora grovesii]|uniref:Rhodopsin domain-containing protein n=1 Tax=Diplogelasinospora grovesii TaxID=303347 RepID=A0AAN6S1Q3_9PEZI|nr:hypothetical protein QBC46DRAFT_416578 [Diplogelasinospora grovesii]
MSLNTSINLCQVPAAPAPDGTVSNFVNPPSLAAALMSVEGIMTAFAIFFSVARLYVNIRKLVWADYFALIAFCMSIAILGIEATLLRMARHIWDGVYFPALLLQIGSFFARASIFLLLYYQLFTAVQRSMRIAIWVGQTFNNFLIYWTGVAAVATYYETPPRGRDAQSALSVALDVYIFVLPLPAIVRLKLPLRKRIIHHGLGPPILAFPPTPGIKITQTNDSTWISVILSLCSAVELDVAIIVSSAPAFSSFAQSHLLLQMSVVNSILSSFSSGGGGSSSSKAYDSEAAVGSGAAVAEHKIGDGNGSSGRVLSGQDPTLDRSHRYYELNDTWMLKSEASVDQKGIGRMPPAVKSGKGGIVHTVTFEQAVRTPRHRRRRG